MSSTAKSRWAEDDAETEAAIAQRKAEKEAKKRAKAERQRKLEEAQKKQQEEAEAATARQSLKNGGNANGDTEPPAKRRRLSNEARNEVDGDGVVEMEKKPSTLLRFPSTPWGPCRHVDNFEKLNHIEEGSYGWVSRAKETATGEIIALKKLKMEHSYDGFPVTGLREIETLLESRHTNIVRLREIVLGDKMDE
ncbi:hypothetical protein FQN54_002888 [Arachnomyces sp. PD_36]|nr:hypothetical protein FQN54_002888 [Arachnomyces sp. PD_36]